MIKACFYRNMNGDIYSVNVTDHGSKIVCAAVSALVLNTLNSIETFTKEKLEYAFNEEGGFLEFTLPEIQNGKQNPEVRLLLNSLYLGLTSIKEEYKGSIKVMDNADDQNQSKQPVIDSQ